MTTPIQVDQNRYWEGLSSLEMVNLVQSRLGVGQGDYTRYTKAQIVQALNMGGVRFAKLTACLLMPVVIIGKANRQNYRVPFGTLRIVGARYYTGEAQTDYTDLKVLRDMGAMQLRDPMFRGTTGTPDYLFSSYRAGNIQLVGASPIPTVDGAFWDASKYGVVTAATGFQYVGNIVGSHKVGYAASAFFVDAEGRDLSTLGALAGYPIFNITDGSSGVITAIVDRDATKDQATATLSGGTNNYWSPGDLFNIPMGEYGVVLDGGLAETFISSYLGTIGDIAGGANNFVLDVARKPLELSATLDDYISEIPSEYQEAQVAFATYWLGSGQFKGLAQPDKAKEQLALFSAFVDEYNQNPLVEESENEVDYYS
jgi:hypothetical protein